MIEKKRKKKVLHTTINENYEEKTVKIKSPNIVLYVYYFFYGFFFVLPCELRAC